MSLVRLVVTFDLEGATPSETRERFSTALKISIMHAYELRDIDQVTVDELFRAIPGLRSA